MPSSQGTGCNAPATIPGPASLLRLWSVAAMLAALPLSAQAQSGALRNPVLVPGSAWAFDGFRVNVPGDEGWYSLAKDAQYGDLAKDLPGGVKLAAIVDARKLDAPVVGQQELLDYLRQEQTALPDPATMKLVDYTAQPFSPKGVLCSRFAVKLDDRRKSFPAPGLLLVRGTACVRPDQPDVVVTLSYARRGPLDDPSPEAQKAADLFVDSLRFLPSNPALMQQAGLAVRSETPQDAIGLLTPAATDGDTEAALFLGNIYLYGHGVAHDFPAARKWLELAAKDGRAEAMFNLGAMYDKGLGTPRDVAQAIKWFTLAADQRDAPAQLNLALFYLNGDGVPKDIAIAEQWLKRAAGNGSKRAQGILSLGKYKEQQ
jgi:hypothetical protein